VVVAAMVVGDDFVAGQRAGAPVVGEVAEQPVLDLVPCRGAGWDVADGDRQSGLGGQLGQLGCEHPGAVVVGSAGVSGDQQPGGVRVSRRAGAVPPAAQ